MSFALPVALLGLAALPLLVVLYALLERRRVREGARFGAPALRARSSRLRRRTTAISSARASHRCTPAKAPRSATLCCLQPTSANANAQATAASLQRPSS